MVRPGLALYGLGPRPEMGEGLRPALSLFTQVIFLKDHPSGRPIGYGREHTTSRRTRIATLPVGYNDGYPYRLSGKGEVLIRGRRAPVVGRVSMDYTMVDVGALPGVSSGDDVVLIGGSGEERIGALELADRSGTIIYEILTGIGKRVARVYTSREPRAAVEPASPRGFRLIRRPDSSDEAPVRR
ncbi:MAG: hypothetical protein HC813_01450 [Planctomycetes bacterium]|nr:hypothetical protein [Planctomycetota bacterium]